jgi:hypothetical protein
MPRLSHAREVCPKCGSLHVRKYGKLQLKEKVLQKYRCMDCRHVWYERIGGSIPQKAFELILSMLRVFIRDMDQGKSVNDAGWLPLNEEDIRSLQKISFCEIDYENMCGRVNPYGNLSEDFLLTEEGHIFSEYVKSLNIAEEVRKICKNEEEYCSTIGKGLKLMFQGARYTFWEKEEAEETVPEDVRSVILSSQWVRASETFADMLVKELLASIYGACESIDMDKNVAKRKDNNPLFNNVRIRDQWEKIIEYFSKHREVIDFLGLIWFAIKKVDENGIDHVGARIFILDEIIKAVADKRCMNEDDLRAELKRVGEDLDGLIEKESWGLNWSDVFTIPW